MSLELFINILQPSVDHRVTALGKTNHQRVSSSFWPSLSHQVVLARSLQSLGVGVGPWFQLHRNITESSFLLQYTINQEYSVFFWWVVRFRNNSLTCFCPCWCFWNSTSYWCLVEIGLEWGNGMIIDRDYGSFPHSLLSTSKTCLFPNCQFKLRHGATPPALTTCHCPILSRWLGDIPIAGQTRVNFVSKAKCVPL
jgi:hypothetical protein